MRPNKRYRMKRFVTLIIGIFWTYSISIAFGQNSVKDYSDFLNREHLSPKEYIFKLFETNDIIILGERDHRDTTQYDLILDIISDERFINNIGHIYTEVGVINRTDWANNILKKQYSNNNEFEKELIKLYRELDFNPVWEKYNMYKYLKGVYGINKTLPNEKKLTIGLTDVEFDWNEMNADKYANFMSFLYKEVAVIRDSIMALNFINLYEKQTPINGKRKALYIQSHSHAININVTVNNNRIKSVGHFLKEAYGENVKIVLINWYNFGGFYFMPKQKVSLVDGGKWDAAFELSNHKSIGFNLKESPFRATQYFPYQKFKYQDVADGFIFYLPFYKFVCTIGMPKIIDEEFVEELLNRYVIVFGENNKRTKEIQKSPEKAKKMFTNYHNRVKSFNCCENCRRLRREMKKWL